MVHQTGAGPGPSRGTGHGMVVETGESRFGGVRALRSPARRNSRDSRNIAVALVLLAFAVIMFLVTIVKFEEQIQRIGVSQNRGAATPPHVPTSGAAAFLPIGDARAAGPYSGRPEQSVGGVLAGITGAGITGV